MKDKIIENEVVEKEKKEEVTKKDLRSTLYGNIDLSVETMDKIIMVLFIAIILSLILGIM